jgi:dUTP pyrophosphatase
MSEPIEIPCVTISVPDRSDTDHPETELPRYAKPGDAGLDLRSRISAVVRAGGHRLQVPTGLAVAIPEGYAGFVLPRSGLALRHGITCMNAPGLVDSGYRGELQVILVNTDPVADFEIAVGDRIAQLVVMAVPPVRLVAVEELDETERGAGGFGHTGV